jgi:peptide chain release factor 1
MQEENESISGKRKEQMKSGDISDKIRTYNWPNDRITDHRLGEAKFGIDEMLNGGELLEEFIDDLINLEREEMIKNFVLKLGNA